MPTPALSILTFPFSPEVTNRRIRLDSLFALLRSRGITTLDMFAFEVVAYGGDRVMRALEANDLSVSSLIFMLNFLGGEKKIRRKVAKIVRMARRLGATRVMVVPTDAVTAPRRMSRMSVAERLDMHAEGFRIAVQIGDAAGIEVLLEDTPMLATSLSSAAHCRELLDRVPGLGIVFDTGNMYPTLGDPIEFFHAVKDRIRHVHLKDVELVSGGAGDPTVDGRRSALRVPGDGQVPLAEIVRLLAADGYTGSLSIEYKRPEKGASLVAHTAQLDRHIHGMRTVIAAAHSTDGLPGAERPFRWAYIGAGAIARDTSRKILATRRHEIATVFSRSTAKRDRFAARVGARSAPSLTDAITDPTVDGVYIATPANSHAEIARAAIGFGKPVLLEKPFTPDATSAATLFALAEERGVYLTEAMWTWFSPVARRVRAWIEDGAIGEVTAVKVTLGFGIVNLIPRLKDPWAVGGALLDLGIYGTTYVVNLFGIPDHITAAARKKHGVDVTDELVFRWDSGPTARLFLSIDQWRGEMLTITGTHGSIRVPVFHAARSATLRREGSRRRVFRANGGYDRQFDVVAREIREGRRASRYVPPEATVGNLRVLDEIRRLVDIRFPFESQLPEGLR